MDYVCASHMFTDVGSSVKEPEVLDHHIHVSTDKHGSKSACKTVHFSEVNGVNTC